MTRCAALASSTRTTNVVSVSHEESQVRTVHIAGRHDARFVPTDPGSWAHYEYRLRRAQLDLRRLDIDLKVVSAMAAADVPAVRNVSGERLAAIRRDDDAFNEWRASLRSAVRAVLEWPTEQTFAAEASAVVADYIEPAAAEIRRSVGRKASLAQLRDHRVRQAGDRRCARRGRSRRKRRWNPRRARRLARRKHQRRDDRGPVSETSERGGWSYRAPDRQRRR